MTGSLSRSQRRNRLPGQKARQDARKSGEKQAAFFCRIVLM